MSQRDLLTFLAAAAMDFSWLRWVTAARRTSVIPTAVWSVVIGALGLLGLTGALEGVNGLLSYLGGLAAGSVVAVLWSRWRDV